MEGCAVAYGRQRGKCAPGGSGDYLRRTRASTGEIGRASRRTIRQRDAETRDGARKQGCRGGLGEAEHYRLDGCARVWVVCRRWQLGVWCGMSMGMGMMGMMGVASQAAQQGGHLLANAASVGLEPANERRPGRARTDCVSWCRALLAGRESALLHKHKHKPKDQPAAARPALSLDFRSGARGDCEQRLRPTPITTDTRRPRPRHNTPRCP